VKNHIGKITVSRLRVECLIGCNLEERQKTQEIFIDIALTLSLPARDALEETVDYGEAAALATACATTGQFYLIERLATHIAEVLLARFLRLQQACIVITKPGAVIGAVSAGCEVVLNREDMMS